MDGWMIFIHVGVNPYARVFDPVGVVQHTLAGTSTVGVNPYPEIYAPYRGGGGPPETSNINLKTDERNLSLFFQ